MKQAYIVEMHVSVARYWLPVMVFTEESAAHEYIERTKEEETQPRRVRPIMLVRGETR